MSEIIIAIITAIEKVNILYAIGAFLIFAAGALWAEYYYNKYLITRQKLKETISIKGKSYRLITEEEAVNFDLWNLSIKTKRDSK